MPARLYPVLRAVHTRDATYLSGDLSQTAANSNPIFQYYFTLFTHRLPGSTVADALTSSRSWANRCHGTAAVTPVRHGGGAGGHRGMPRLRSAWAWGGVRRCWRASRYATGGPHTAHTGGPRTVCQCVRCCSDRVTSGSGNRGGTGAGACRGVWRLCPPAKAPSVAQLTPEARNGAHAPPQVLKCSVWCGAVAYPRMMLKVRRCWQQTRLARPAHPARPPAPRAAACRPLTPRPAPAAPCRSPAARKTRLGAWLCPTCRILKSQ